METKKKLTLRKPLEPIDDEAACKVAFASLLAEYEELKKLKVKEACQFAADGKTLVSLADYNKQVAAYSTRRDEYIERHSEHVETIEMVKIRIRDLKRDFENASNEDWEEKFDALYAENCKFEELQRRWDETFEHVAKHARFRGY